MSWQDLAQVSDYNAVMTRLDETLQEREKEQFPHANVVVPLKTFNAVRNGQDRRTLDGIRGFLPEQLGLLQVENRVLNVSIFELRRPVKYFWSLHDFIEGLRDAIKGHEFLTSIGILHRDVGENNIVLGVYPWEERGYLIDSDMAILQDAEEPTQTSSTQSDSRPPHPTGESSTRMPQGGRTKHIKGLRTGTFPYISFTVLLGYRRHTHFDDVESFLYVLLLFLFSYAGPLPKGVLQDAHEKGFVLPIGSGALPHMRRWPQKLLAWADGDPWHIAASKFFYIWSARGVQCLCDNAEISDSLRNNWPEDLRSPIRDLLSEAFAVFRKTLIGNQERTEVSHAQFIKVLDDWLEKHSELGRKYSPAVRGYKN
ncbi:hypothetical protein V8E55_008894 [Tylopilus felleus]